MILINLPTVAGGMVVRSNELFAYLNEGWRLVFAFEESDGVPQSTWDGTKYVTSPVAMVAKFLIVRGNEEEALTQALRAKDSFQKQLSDANRILSDERVKVIDLEKAVAKAKEEIGRINERWNVEIRNHEETRKKMEKMQRLESDLAKLRSALGEIRTKEILGA